MESNSGGGGRKFTFKIKEPPTVPSINSSSHQLCANKNNTSAQNLFGSKNGNQPDVMVDKTTSFLNKNQLLINKTMEQSRPTTSVPENKNSNFITNKVVPNVFKLENSPGPRFNA
jgi:hypothetical protein